MRLKRTRGSDCFVFLTRPISVFAGVWKLESSADKGSHLPFVFRHDLFVCKIELSWDGIICCTSRNDYISRGLWSVTASLYIELASFD